MVRTAGPAFGFALAAALTAGCAAEPAAGPVVAAEPAAGEAQGVCPPFPLRDEDGNAIDPVHGVNADRPYSPRRTCGGEGCHDYDRITEGFHFQQGRGEPVPASMAARYNWVTSPGNYGGTWCSPAPLYRQLAPKHNADARMIDMTSFDRHDVVRLRDGDLRQLPSGRRAAGVRPRRPALRCLDAGPGVGADRRRREQPRRRLLQGALVGDGRGSRPTACSATCPSTTTRSATPSSRRSTSAGPPPWGPDSAA